MVEGYPIWYPRPGLPGYARGSMFIYRTKRGSGPWELHILESDGRFASASVLATCRTLEEAVHFGLLYEWENGITNEPRRGDPKLAALVCT